MWLSDPLRDWNRLSSRSPRATCTWLEKKKKSGIPLYSIRGTKHMVRLIKSHMWSDRIFPVMYHRSRSSQPNTVRASAQECSPHTLRKSTNSFCIFGCTGWEANKKQVESRDCFTIFSYFQSITNLYGHAHSNPQLQHQRSIFPFASPPSWLLKSLHSL